MTVQFQLRAATAEDAEAIAQIWNPIIRDTEITFNSQEKTPAQIAHDIQDRTARGHGMFVAHVQGRCVGFAGYDQFRGGVGYAKTMEHTIILSPEARGQGGGRALMERLEAHAAAAGAHAIMAGVSAANPAGISFHERLGYQRRCVLPQVGFKFGRYLDLVLLQKFITIAR